MKRRNVLRVCVLSGLVFLIFIAVPSSIWAQSRYTISGYVYDRNSNETLIGASVYDPITFKGTSTNNFGFYSITLPASHILLKSSYVGYTTDSLSFELDRDTVINIHLGATTRLQEVVVEAQQGGSFSNVKNTKMGTINLTSKTISSVPAILGEVDLIKVLQLMPGVSAGTEGFSGLYVRGGGKDENLYLLDDNPLYDVNHLFGFISTFNPDAIKSTEFYKSSFPARFSGRLSSVVDVHTKDGNMKEHHGTVTVGLLSAKVQLEGPIVKDKASYNVSFRRTYLDLLIKPMMWYANTRSDNEKNNFGYDFYDLNAKVNYKFSDKSRLYFNIYSGQDAFNVKQSWQDSYTAGDMNSGDVSSNYDGTTKFTWTWGNFLSSLNWNYIFNSKLFANFKMNYSSYKSDINMDYSWNYYETGNDSHDYFNYKYNSGIHDWSYRMDFDYTPNTNNTIKFGAAYTLHHFSPEQSGIFVKSSSSADTLALDTSLVNNSTILANELNVYAEDEIEITDKLLFNVGLNATVFQVSKKTYTSIQPRLSMRYLITDDFSAKASYTVMSQYVHLLSSSTISMPTDLWVPVTADVKPLLSKQTSAGLYYNWKNAYNISLEAYYKTMDNIIAYKDGYSMFSSSVEWQNRIAEGKGTSKGTELLIQKTGGKLTGWFGYGLSWTDRQFPGGEINAGNKYWAKYDCRHKINIVGIYQLNDHIDINASWTYYTGARMTVALESYTSAPVNPGDITTGYVSNGSIPYYNEKNNYKMSDYHRLDVGINFKKTKANGNMRIWNVSVYNIYNHRNAMFAYPEERYSNDVYDQGTVKPRMTEYSLLGLIPSVSYTYKF